MTQAFSLHGFIVPNTQPCGLGYYETGRWPFEGIGK